MSVDLKEAVSSFSMNAVVFSGHTKVEPRRRLNYVCVKLTKNSYPHNVFERNILGQTCIVLGETYRA